MTIKDKIIKELQRLLRRLLKDNPPKDEPTPTPAPSPTPSPSPQPEPQPEPQPSPQPEPQERLEWSFGGFNGGKAKVDQSVTLSSVKVKGDTISYAWKGKVPSSWSRRSTEKGNLLVFAVFVKQGDCWVGGKIDWTDENRTSRNIENIRHGYNGWNPSLWDSAAEIGICVASEDGKFRSALSTARK